MLVVMARMNQKDNDAARWPRSLPTSAVACTWLVLLVTIFTLYSLLWSACSRCFASWLVWTVRRSSSFAAMACAGLFCWLRCTPRCVPLVDGLCRRQWWQYTPFEDIPVAQQRRVRTVQLCMACLAWPFWWRRRGVVCCSFAAIFGLPPSGR